MLRHQIDEGASCPLTMTFARSWCATHRSKWQTLSAPRVWRATQVLSSGRSPRIRISLPSSNARSLRFRVRFKISHRGTETRRCESRSRNIHLYLFFISVPVWLFFDVETGS
jgi:hypothetical protein